MNLPRIAVLFVACSVALSAAAKSRVLQESGSKPAARPGDFPKTIAGNMTGNTHSSEGNFLVAEAMPENKYAFVPPAETSMVPGASANK